MDSDFVAALAENAQQVLADFCTITRRHRLLDDGADFDRELWQTMADLGWLTLALPEEHGGMDGGIAALALLQQAIGRALASVPFLTTSLVARAIASWPHANVGAAKLPSLGSGESIGGVSCDPEATTMIVLSRAEGSEFRLDGTCQAVLAGDLAQILLLSVVDREGRPGLALVDAAAPGLTVSTLPVADATQRVASIRCENTPVPFECVVVGEQAVALADRLAHDAALLTAHDALGGSEAALAETIEYLKVRVQFGKPIGTFQALKHRCADHKVALEATRWLLVHAVDVSTLAREELEQDVLPALAKFHACETYAAIAADCVQMHGGIGYTWEHDAHVYLKRSRLDQFLFGNSTWQQDRAAGRLIAAAEVTR